uniref:Uncharacterized protein n=1 Tax=Anguilla anguilla TaxID=7936 RepID=A0A0E9VFS0_ANGAN
MYNLQFCLSQGLTPYHCYERISNGASVFIPVANFIFWHDRIPV